MKQLAQNNKTAKSILIVSIIIFVYWNLVHNFDMYRYAVLGAIYEMTALLMVAATYILPLFLVVLALANKFRINTKYYISLGIWVLTFVLLRVVYN